MVILIIVVLVLIAGIWAVVTTNGFKAKEIKIDESLSGIEVALTKRFDMLTKMFDVAKGYAKHEKELITETINLRKGMSISEMNDASVKMDSMARSINVTAEAYPTLTSNTIFMDLQAGIRDAEEHLQAARRLYNANVTAYNTAIVMFPASLLAGGRTKKDLFIMEESKRQDVSMKF